MRKVIFNSESIKIKGYLEKRFQVEETPLIYIAGNTKQLRIDSSIQYLRTVLQEDEESMYSLTIEDDHTVEVLEYDGFKFELYSHVPPEKLMEDKKLREILKIGVFHKVSANERIEVEILFKKNGFSLNKDLIFKGTSHYKVSQNKDYFVVKFPLIGLSEEIKKDFVKMNHLVLSITSEENTNKSFVF